ncbi:MAG: proteasome subunit beta [Acidimicrobiia bacterium]
MSDTPLPWFPSGADPGASFADVLRRLSPEAVPLPPQGPAPTMMPAGLPIPHATTIVCLRYAGGVVMAGDRRATEGHTIASRRMDKVMPADGWSGVAIAGAAGPAIEMVKLFQTELEHYEKVEGEPLSLEGKANRLGQMIRANLPAAMAGLVVVPLFAGYDLRRHEGRLFKYDVTGGRYEETNFATTGSGGVHARNWIKGGYRDQMAVTEAVDLGLLALFQAADEDAATGGPDLVRNIYPTVATIDRDGFVLLPEADVEARVTEVLGRMPQP